MIRLHTWFPPLSRRSQSSRELPAVAKRTEKPSCVGIQRWRNREGSVGALSRTFAGLSGRVAGHLHLEIAKLVHRVKTKKPRIHEKREEHMAMGQTLSFF